MSPTTEPLRVGVRVVADMVMYCRLEGGEVVAATPFQVGYMFFLADYERYIKRRIVAVVIVRSTNCSMS